MTSPALKLAGTDAEDVAILSAVLQDAVVLATEIRHDPAAQQFSFIAQRYRWEDTGQDGTRINCRVIVIGASSLAAQATTRQAGKTLADDAFALLALRLEEQADAALLQVDFAGDTRLRLTLAPGWQLRLEDFGQPWPAPCPKAHHNG